MNELNNIVTAVGNYNGIATTITSNNVVVNMIDGLTIIKSANKTNWADGNLEYTIVINNGNEVKVTDVIDTNLFTFITDSVTINNASSSEYTYDAETGTLTINLSDVLPSGRVVRLSFKLRKKTNKFFSSY